MTAAQTRTAAGKLHLSDGPVHLVRDETTTIIAPAADSRETRLQRLAVLLNDRRRLWADVTVLHATEGDAHLAAQSGRRSLRASERYAAVLHIIAADAKLNADAARARAGL